MSNAISPLDGRYYSKLSHLAKYFSENALFKYRIQVEILYFIQLFQKKIIKANLPATQIKRLLQMVEQFDNAEALKIKKIEQTTRHDVKAVEYYIKEKLEVLKLSKYSEFVHFGLTSQDINNTAIPMLLRDATREELIPSLEKLCVQLKEIARSQRRQAMLARTHGQAASPTTLGKEIYVFVERLQLQLSKLKSFEYSAKFGGATGNFNAHKIAFPKTDWRKWADDFVKNKLKLSRQQTTTQIAHYDEIAEWCHIVLRINTILIDLSRDIWTYISMDYFTQQVNKNEVGSSAMPHKVNPIDFENAEGNLSLSNSTLSFLAEKLPISRLQRDLTDSTVLRNIGIPFSHTFLALTSLQLGLSKLKSNKEKIDKDLNDHWIILAEAIQTILRRENVKGAYELLKDLTRNRQSISKKDLIEFIDQLKIDEKIKQELKKISPFNYIGFADKF